jgi:probable HAF family extracellular repeat protein
MNSLKLQVLSHTSIFAIAAIIFMASAAGIFAAPTFTNLGTISNEWFAGSIAAGVSDDGAVVVGNSTVDIDTGHAFRWTSDAGMQDLGTLPGGAQSEAFGLSGDGSVVVGVNTSSLIVERAFRWTASGGMIDLGTLPNGDRSYAYGISSDGSVVVGVSSEGLLPHAFRWTAAEGMQDIGTLPNGAWASATGVSGDGAVVVGNALNVCCGGGPENLRAFRWTADGGMQDLGTLPGGRFSQAWSANADGAVVVGGANFAGPDPDAQHVFHAQHVFRWTSSGGMQDLGCPPGGYSCFAYDVSGDGSAIVGRDITAGRASLWTAQLGMVDLNTYLPTLGLDLAGWQLTEARAISTDGSVIVGYGFYNGDTRAWRVTGIPPALPGDHNGDGIVNAADYVVWRKGLGTTYTQNDFNIWRTNFGHTAGSGAAGYPLGASAAPLSAAVPEPRAGQLILIGCVVALAIRSRRAAQRDVRFMRILLGRRYQFHSTAFSTIVATACVTLALSTNVSAANYSFTSIADVSGPFSSFRSVDINDNGTVAFVATLDAGGAGIFTGGGGMTTLLLDDSGPLRDFGDIFAVPGGVSINNVGTVAFFANLDAGGSGIFTTSGGPFATIVDTNGPVFRFANGGPSINDSGTVAFFAELDSGGGAILTGNGGPLNTIADNVGPGMFSSIFPVDPAINNNGEVAFVANFNAGPTTERGIFTGNGGQTTSIVDGSGPFSSIGFAFPPAINDRGNVAYHTQFDTGRGEIGIFINAGTTIVSSSGPFSSFGHKPAINSRGTVAFNASLDAGGSGIFIGSDPVADKVIRTGDSLFGSTVAAVGFDGELNENGDIPFAYILANGSGGIAVAKRQPNIPVAAAIPKPELRADTSVEFRTNTPAGFTASDIDTATIPGRAQAHASHPDFPTNTAFADAYAEVPIVPMTTADFGKVGSRSYGESPPPGFGGPLENPTKASAEARQVIRLTVPPGAAQPVDIDMTLHVDGNLQQRLIGIWECESPCDPVSFPDPGQLTTLVSLELNTYTASGRVTQFEASATLDWSSTEVLKLTATGPWAVDFTPLVQPWQGGAGGSSVSSTQFLDDMLILAPGEEFTAELIMRTEVFNHYISTRLLGISFADFFDTGAMTFSTDTPGATIVLVHDTLPGDFNNDGSVDAADYVVWRKGLGTTYTQGDYDLWRAHFGRAPTEAWSAGSGAALPSAAPLSASVPELRTIVLAAIAATTWMLTRIPRSSRPTTPPVSRVQ